MPGLDEVLDTGDGFELEFDPSEEDLGAAGLMPPPEADEKPEGEDENDKYVSRAKFEELQNQLSELRGRQAALQERPTQPAPVTPAAPTGPDQNALQAQLKERLRSISQKMYDPDTAADGLEEFLQLTARISEIQAQNITQQYAGSAVSTAADLMIDRFMDRKEKQDKFFPEVQERFEAELKKYDRSAVAKLSRDQLLPALENVYKAVKADVLEEKYNAAQQRAEERKRKAGNGQPPLLGGGKGGVSLGGGKAEVKVSEKSRDFARRAGLSDEDIDALFATTTEDNDEW